VQQNGSNVATGLSYAPFGGLKSLTYGNALSRSIGYDTQYRIASLQTGAVQNLGYGFDNNGNITAITDLLNGSNSKTYGYDALDRLSSASGPWGSIGWSYDPVGNRLTQTDSSGTATYNYQSGSNRLTGISGAESASYSLDANGNTTAASSNGYTYNQNQRLKHAAASQSADYQYNAQGQRAIKTVGGQVTVYHYDQAGQLLAETDASGAVQADYLHLDGQPLAKIDATGTSYIHPDHLGTPQLMTDSQGTVVWQIEARPFGDSPTITGTQTLNLRFPGQYYDAESGLHQNWFRDYQPNLGRYVEADPIGLAGGAGIYTYVLNSPARLIDSYGLMTDDARRRYSRSYQPALIPLSPSDSYGAASYRSADGHLFVIGGGLLEVKCCTEDGQELKHLYWKVCIGAGLEASRGNGVVSNSNGKSCSDPPRNLLGGELSGGVYVGADTSAVVDMGGRGFSSSLGVSFSVGYPAKAVGCYYQLWSSMPTNKKCENKCER
jgi:RHS repeat-associated protein